MKRQFIALTGAVALAMVAAGECRAQSKPLEANVPFAFEVGGKTLPAGRYRIESMATGAGSLQVIRSFDGEAKATISTIADSAPGATDPELIFHRFGKQYFLAQVRTGGGRTQDVFPSRQEKEMARLESSTEVALLAHEALPKQ